MCITYTTDKIEKRIFEVYERIQPKERPRIYKFGAYTPAKTLESEKRIAKELEKQAKEKYNNFVYLGDVKINIIIYKKDGKGRGDIDNNIKTILDATLKANKNNISGAIIYDDVDVVEINTKFEFSENSEGFKMEVVCLENKTKQSKERQKRRIKKIKEYENENIILMG